MKREFDLFANYINQFDLNIKPLKMKEEHTYRVLGYARDIAKSLSLYEGDIKTACACALFHDLGRFPQYSKYHTYQDKLSIDHGDKSYEILKELGYEDNNVLSAVKYHNKYMVPNNLSESEIMFLNITRDADKIDILLTQLNDKYKEDFKLTDDIMKYFYEQKLIPNNIKDYKTVSLLRKLAFIFDINYPRSFEIIKESNIINHKINNIYDAINDDKIFEIRDILNERIDENVRKKIRSRAS